MAITREAIADAIERHIRTEHFVSVADPVFTRDAHLFELGFVDSVGFVELLEFIQAHYGVEPAGEQVFEEKITSINGISEIVWSMLQPA
jgi:acyl carrier protein